MEIYPWFAGQLEFNKNRVTASGRKQTLICEICASVFTFSMNNFTEM